MKIEGNAPPISSKFLLTDSDSVSQCNFVSDNKRKKRIFMERMEREREENKKSIFKIEEISQNMKMISERVKSDNVFGGKLQDFVMKKRVSGLKKLFIKPKKVEENNG